MERATAVGTDRRRFLRAAGLTAAGFAIGGVALSQVQRPSGSPLSPARTPRRASLHTHASGSEGIGAYDGHLAQAARHGFAVVAFTEHNVTMRPDQAPAFPFTGPSVRLPGGAIELVSEQLGALAGNTRGFVRDPALGRDVYVVTAQGAGAAEAYCGAYLSDAAPTLVPFAPYRRPTYLQVPVVSLRVDSSGTDAAGTVAFSLSWHPSYEGRPEGVYRVEYRFFGTAGGAGGRRYVVTGRRGIVWVPVPQGAWIRQRMNLDDDASVLWPNAFVKGDNAVSTAHFGATSRNGAPARVSFRDYVLDRAGVLDPLVPQAQILQRYRARFPDILIVQGVELSDGPHVNYLGERPFLDALSSLADQMPAVHRGGGIASLNHPFGTDADSLRPEAEQRAALTEAVRTYLPQRYFGADLLEVYPRRRGGVGMAQHVELWDVASRNGIFLTHVMASDDHSGIDWLKQKNPGYTTAYTAAPTVPALQQALAAGRAFTAVLGEFDGELDVTLAGAPMGAVVVGTRPGTEAVVHATGLPPGGGVEVVQGPVDYAGLADPGSGARVVRSTPARRVGARPLSVALGSTRNTYTRVQVVDAEGRVVALSQPVWCVDRPPPGGVPAARRPR